MISTSTLIKFNKRLIDRNSRKFKKRKGVLHQQEGLMQSIAHKKLLIGYIERLIIYPSKRCKKQNNYLKIKPHLLQTWSLSQRIYKDNKMFLRYYIMMQREEVYLLYLYNITRKKIKVQIQLTKVP